MTRNILHMHLYIYIFPSILALYAPTGFNGYHFVSSSIETGWNGGAKGKKGGRSEGMDVHDVMYSHEIYDATYIETTHGKEGGGLKSEPARSCNYLLFFT